ncbi:MAG TPA: hypothetical protein VK656_02715 [Candidatus Acidoferrum sp.]|nr:hypothetical protein [Candidatus Acidoferrum sp.]
MVAQPSPAEQLPALYRAVLAGVEALERRGRRAEAATIRRDAIRAYSASWDERHREMMVGLIERLHRDLDRGTIPVMTTVEKRWQLLGSRDR